MHGAGDVRDRLRALLIASQTIDAVGLLYREYRVDIRCFVASRISQPDRVDDVCGEVWLSVVAALERFRGEAAPLTWLMEIARHKVADLIRRDAGRPVVPIEHVAAALCTTSSEQPSRRIQREQSRYAVRRLMSRFSPAEQELLELRYVRGLTPAQIVKEKWPSECPNTVSKRLSLLRKRMRQMLAEESALA